MGDVAALAFGHGANDAQKSAGVIAALLLADGRANTLASPLSACSERDRATPRPTPTQR
jgi:phosphate/sulfate permease